jgi:hypothetical protein
LLASHGIIAATIDVNFLNGSNFGENDARAIVHLEHLKQFRSWNNMAGHPLHGRLDLNGILIVGHSRGGEAVGHASFFNRLAAIGPVVLDGSAGLGPYRFGLSAAAAIAPTDRQFVPATGPTVVPDSYFIIHGSKDSDVFTFEGYHTYERVSTPSRRRVANPQATIIFRETVEKQFSKQSSTAGSCRRNRYRTTLRRGCPLGWAAPGATPVAIS